MQDSNDCARLRHTYLRPVDDLGDAQHRLEAAKRLVVELEWAITGYYWEIDHAPREMVQNGCDPV